MITSRVETITPEYASDALEKLAHQRPLSRQLVSRLSTDILAGRFMLNGEPIIFGSNGELLDGMHRLYAIYEADVPVSALVVRGVSFDSFKTIDTGKARSFSDMLKINNGTGGKWNLPRLAAVVASMATNGGSMHSVGATMSDMLEARQKYAFAIDSFADQANVISSNRLVPSFVVGGVFAAVITHHDTLEKAKQFLQALTTGVIDYPRTHGSSAVALRNFLLVTTASGSWGRVGFYKKSQRAFKAYLNSETYTKLFAPPQPIWDVSVGSEWWNEN